MGEGVDEQERTGPDGMKSPLVLAISALVTILVGLGLLAGCQAQPSPTPTPTVEKTFPSPAAGGATATGVAVEGPDPIAGREVFNRLCTACHPGGQQGLGPSLVGVTDRKTTQGIVNQIRDGGSIMPAFPAAQITDRQIEDVIAFLKTLGGGATAPTASPTRVASLGQTPSPSATPLAPVAGNAQAGEQVFASNCTMCHPGGQQGLGPSLIGVTGRLSEQQLVNQVRNGSGIMPGFSGERISDAQLTDLLAYLKTLK